MTDAIRNHVALFSRDLSTSAVLHPSFPHDCNNGATILESVIRRAVKPLYSLFYEIFVYYLKKKIIIVFVVRFTQYAMNHRRWKHTREIRSKSAAGSVDGQRRWNITRFASFAPATWSFRSRKTRFRNAHSQTGDVRTFFTFLRSVHTSVPKTAYRFPFKAFSRWRSLIFFSFYVQRSYRFLSFLHTLSHWFLFSVSLRRPRIWTFVLNWKNVRVTVLIAAGRRAGTITLRPQISLRRVWRFTVISPTWYVTVGERRLRKLSSKSATFSEFARNGVPPTWSSGIRSHFVFDL